MSKDEVKISKIVVKIGDKELNLSLEEARELQNILENLFASKEIKVIRDIEYIPYRVNIPYTPPNPIWWCTTTSASNSAQYTLTISSVGA